MKTGMFAAFCLLLSSSVGHAWVHFPEAPPTLEQGNVIQYKVGQPIPQWQMFQIPDPESLGGVVLEGNPKAFIRLDYETPQVLAGIFEVTQGTVQITFPFTEHATIIAGFVRITDETGASRIYGPGDSYVVKAGTVVTWEVLGPFVQKSFLDIFE